MVAEGLGWSLTTPTFLARQLELLDKLECQPLPAPGITRQLAVISRKGEFGNMIEEFVADIREIILGKKVHEVQKTLAVDWRIVPLPLFNMSMHE